MSSPIRLLSLELGSTEAGRGVVEELRRIVPGIWIAGVEKRDDYADSVFDFVVTTQYDAFLGRYESVNTADLAMTPELNNLMSQDEGKILNLLGLAAARPASSYPNPIYGVPEFQDSYDSRKDLFDRHCRFWNFILDYHQIDAVIHENLGQEGYDYVALQLARAKGVPTLVFNIAGQMPRVLFAQESESGIGDLGLGGELKKRLSSDLAHESPNFVRRCLPRFMDSADSGAHKGAIKDFKTNPLMSWLLDRNVFGNALGPATTIAIVTRKVFRFFQNPKQSLRALARSRELIKSARHSMQEERSCSQVHASDVNYVYFPLHFQPETSTSIKARDFYRQREIVAFVAGALPKDWVVVVKEHPHQFRRLLKREEGFYAQIASITRATLVHHSTDNRKLVDNAKAVICASYSSISTHAASTGKPIICVGDSYFREAPGYYCVKNSLDLQNAINLIQSPQANRHADDFDDFIARLEQSTFEGEFGEKFDDVSDEEWAQTMAATRHNISRVIREWLKLRGLVH